MKKLFLSATLLFAFAFIAKADHDVPANWNAEGGYHSYVYDCQTGGIVSSLPQLDETFTFAVDITGDENLLKFINDWTPSVEGAQKSFAIHFWNDLGNAGDARLMHIEGNIYGATINLKYLVANAGAAPVNPDLSNYLLNDSVYWWHAVVVGFCYNESEAGIDWWKSGQTGEGGVRPDYDFGVVHLRTAAYDGSHATDENFYADDLEPVYPWYTETTAGMAAPCATASLEPEAIETVSLTTNATVVSREYFNVLGQKLSVPPVKGIYVERAKMSNGSVVSKKLIAVGK
ncbi:MAG: hypothetical protein LBQ31_00530 [Bacteroidales bacterium]|jgi:hypothetical protein|nr:hypothetical protein [Bacteroidales bacterium]